MALGDLTVRFRINGKDHSKMTWNDPPHVPRLGDTVTIDGTVRSVVAVNWFFYDSVYITLERLD